MEKNDPNSTDFYDKFQQVAKNIEGFWFFSIFIYSTQPNLAKSSYGRLPLQLRQKIEKRNPDGQISMFSLCSQKHRRMVEDNLYFISGLQPDLVKSSFGMIITLDG